MQESSNLPCDLTSGEPTADQPTSAPVATTASDSSSVQSRDPNQDPISDPIQVPIQDPNQNSNQDSNQGAHQGPNQSPHQGPLQALNQALNKAPYSDRDQAPYHDPNQAPNQDQDQDLNEDENDPANYHEESLGERVGNGYKTTFHVYKNNEQVCYYLERIYDLEGKMVRMVKRSADGRSETRFDANTGDIERIFEAYTLPDGNHLSKEKRYLAYDNTTESVLVVCPGGGLVRAVVREAVGLVNIFQGQTEFARDGHATVSINHWFDLKTSKMTMREQIQWLPGGERGVTEHFYFAEDGGLLNYRKVLYHPGTDRFLEEVHIYEAHSQKLQVKEVKSFERNAELADMEVTIFDANGAVVECAKNRVSRVHMAKGN